MVFEIASLYGFRFLKRTLFDDDPLVALVALIQYILMILFSLQITWEETASGYINVLRSELCIVKSSSYFSEGKFLI